jgi:hypothetical protein
MCVGGKKVVLVSLDQSLGHFHAVAAKAGIRQAATRILVFLPFDRCFC